jgi:hypothetical protein
MRAFDLAIELRRTRLDVCVTDALILDVPMELGLEFVAIIGANFPDAEGKALDNVVNEGDGIGLCVPAIDLEGTDAGRIINCCVLVAPGWFAVASLESQELHIDLDLGDQELASDTGLYEFFEPAFPVGAGSAHSDVGFDRPRHPKFLCRVSAPDTRRYELAPDGRSGEGGELSRQSQGVSGWRGFGIVFLFTRPASPCF